MTEQVRLCPAVYLSVLGECQKVWGSAGFVRIYGHMIHRRPTDTAVAIGCLYRDRREGYRHGGRQAVRKRQQCPPRTVDRAGHPRPRHALPDCPTLFGTLQYPPPGRSQKGAGRSTRPGNYQRRSGRQPFQHLIRHPPSISVKGPDYAPEPLRHPFAYPSHPRRSRPATTRRSCASPSPPFTPSSATAKAAPAPAWPAGTPWPRPAPR